MMRAISLLWIGFFLLGCERQIGTIRGESVGYTSFIEKLKRVRIDLRGRKLEVLKEELLDWKRLRQELEDYLDRESIWEELKGEGYEEGREEQERVYELIGIGKKGDWSKGLELRIKRVILEEELDSFLGGEGELELGGGVRISYWEFLELYPEDLLRGWGGRNEGGKRKVRDMLRGVIINVLKGRELDSGGWGGLELGGRWEEEKELRWKEKLIWMYRKKVEEEYREELMGKEERLREYYFKNQSQYGYERVTVGGERRRYQLSYSRVRGDLIEEFLRRELEEWQKGLWAKHGMGIEEEYFKGLGAREVELERRR